MLYRLLHVLMRAAFGLYFGKVERRGLEEIERPGPALILANHTNSFMDAMLLAVYLRRRIHFFARGDAFGKPWADRLLRSLGLLPVYRLKEGKELLGRNEESNDEALRILQAGGAVLIFAEGASHVAKLLKPLKKGPFRLAVRAAGMLGEPLRIAPLGISFAKPETPGTDAWLVAGAAFAVKPQEEEGEAGAARAALLAMRETAARLAPVVPDVRSMDMAAAADLVIEMARVEKGAALHFEELHRLVTRVAEEDAQKEAGIIRLAGQYAEARQAFRLPESAFTKGGLAGRLLSALLLAPLGVPGFLLHAIPFAFARRLVRRYVTDADFIAAVYVPLALVLAVAWYGLVLLPLAVWLAGWRAPLWLLAAAFCGWTSGRWMLPQLKIVSARLQAASLAKKYPDHWSDFMRLRNSLLSHLQ